MSDPEFLDVDDVLALHERQIAERRLDKARLAALLERLAQPIHAG